MHQILIILLFSFSKCNLSINTNQSRHLNSSLLQNESRDCLSKAYFAAGCFWCVETIFESVIGVDEVISGYAGGMENSANYANVSAGKTNHAETVEVLYDSTKISYNTLLEVFFGSHDPTSLNRQGPDIGSQYRSTIFYQSQKQKVSAHLFIQKLEDNKIFDNQIVTTIEKLTTFYPAEDYHQDFKRNNPTNPYVNAVSIPRLNKFRMNHKHLLKK